MQVKSTGRNTAALRSVAARFVHEQHPILTCDEPDLEQIWNRLYHRFQSESSAEKQLIAMELRCCEVFLGYDRDDKDPSDGHATFFRSLARSFGGQFRSLDPDIRRKCPNALTRMNLIKLRDYWRYRCKRDLYVVSARTKKDNSAVVSPVGLVHAARSKLLKGLDGSKGTTTSKKRMFSDCEEWWTSRRIDDWDLDRTNPWWDIRRARQELLELQLYRVLPRIVDIHPKGLDSAMWHCMWNASSFDDSFNPWEKWFVRCTTSNVTELP